MTGHPDAQYRALVARDPRFDGVFYVGVSSTGIYCRPVCTAKTPKSANCRFFGSAESAEKAGFRPCLRCRPELAPGNAPVDDAHRIAGLIAHRIAEGSAGTDAGIEQIATQFGWSSRQIRRMMQKELGVTPMDLVMTRRLLLAKQLLTETRLPITEIAFASGFSSLRRFNDAFSGRYGMPPTAFRKATDRPALAALASERFSLQLSYRAPYDWDGTLAFLQMRALRGVEAVQDGVYLRTVTLGAHTGWVSVRPSPESRRRTLLVELSHELTPALPALLGRLRHLFDLGARPDLIDAHLALDARLAEAIARTPGVRVPGAFDGFELAMRAILGQQVTVKAATTIAARVVEAFGAPVAGPAPESLTRHTPSAARIAATSVDELASLGIVRARAASIIGVAEEIASGRVRLEPGAPVEPVIAQLTALPGIGTWTAQYIALRALRAPDVFPRGDIGLQNALGGVSAKEAEQFSAAWSPWRSYATIRLWSGHLVTDG